MAGSNIPVDVYMYVNPETRVVDEMYCIHPWGLSRREEGDWAPITRDESNLDDLEDHYVYDLDWSTDYAAIDDDSVDDDEEHAAVTAFDNATLDEEGAKKYGILIIDPTVDFDEVDFNSEEA
jgi:hypothetical protein